MLKKRLIFGCTASLVFALAGCDVDVEKEGTLPDVDVEAKGGIAARV